MSSGSTRACAGDDYPDWKVGASVETVSAGLELIPMIPNERKDFSLKFRPAESKYFGLVLGYRWLAGTLAFSSPSSTEVRNREGESEYRDYRLSYYFANWGIEANYNHFKGYLIENSSRLLPTTTNGAEFFRLPEMRSKGYGLNFLRTFGESNYVLSSAVDQSTLQMKTGGAWIGVASLREQIYENPTPFIPAADAANFGEDATLSRVKEFNFSVGPGYGYLWRGPGRLFASGMIAASAGLHHIDYTRASGERGRTALEVNGHVRISFGVNGRHGFYRVGVVVDDYQFLLNSVAAESTITSFNASAGVRF